MNIYGYPYILDTIFFFYFLTFPVNGAVRHPPKGPKGEGAGQTEEHPSMHKFDALGLY